MFAGASLHSSVMISFMAKSGLRPEVLGNHDGTDGLRMRDLPDIAIHQSCKGHKNTKPDHGKRGTLKDMTPVLYIPDIVGNRNWLPISTTDLYLERHRR